MSYLDQLAAAGELTATEHRVLQRARITNALDLYRVLCAFPGLHTAGVRLPALTALAQAQTSDAAIAGVLEEVRHPVPAVTFGAAAPAGVDFGPGEPVPTSLPPPSLVPIAGGIPSVQLDASPWPVRDQGQRGTCVAHAMASCVEHASPRATGALLLDLSEQYLFARARLHDVGAGRSPVDGTWISSGSAVLAAYGICEESVLPYVPTPDPADVGHTISLTPNADTDASTRKRSGRYLSFAGRSPGRAQAISDALVAGTPVAVAVPVFVDVVSGMNNWLEPNARRYGEVLDPLPTMVAAGGHAVCLTGCTPDATAPGGGWFTFRNSWGSSWGSSLPSTGRAAPRVGYGAISFDYVESYLWELFHLHP